MAARLRFRVVRTFPNQRGRIVIAIHMTEFAPSASWRNIKLRSELLRRLRGFFDSRGFVEVETPILSADVVVDRHLEPFRTLYAPDPRRPDEGRELFLQTSPEFHMKRLLASGGEAIYQVARAFRNGERGRLHNPEFTLVEWYRRGDDYDAGMKLLSDLCACLLRCEPAERLTYRDAFVQHAGVDPFAATMEELRRACGAERDFVQDGLETHPIEDIDGLETHPTMDRDALLDMILVDRVEPYLGRGRPTVLCDYPPSQAALAIVRREVTPVAERFELYVDGVELANGYHELLDAGELRRRAAEANDLRAAGGRERLPEESRLLAAMDHGLPACCGCALGFDRVLLLAAGAESIDDVLAFPIGRA